MFGGPNILTLGEQQYFVRDNVSQSTISQEMLKMWGPWLRLCPRATCLVLVGAHGTTLVTPAAEFDAEAQCAGLYSKAACYTSIATSLHAATINGGLHLSKLLAQAAIGKVVP